MVAPIAVLVHQRRQRPVVIHSAPETLDLTELERKDPAFSLPVFESYVFDLIPAAHRGRGDPTLRNLTLYLSPSVIDHLAVRSVQGMVPTQVVIGALRVMQHSVISGQRDQLTVEVEATMIGDGPSRQVVEEWKFVRAEGIPTPAPSERARTAPCSHCGSTQEGVRATCGHCGRPVGTFTWEADRMWLVSDNSARASLTGSVPEAGNKLPTVRQPSVDSALQHVTTTDANVTMAALKHRIELIYRQLNTAWNEDHLTHVRGYVTAALRNYLDYWLREYKAQGLHNTLKDARISKIELSKITRDLFYDAITVRIFATGYDFTTNASGKVVGGSAKKLRPYTEYWTFLRSASRKGPIVVTTNCPNCGAPMSISDLGACTHCNAMVESGGFDWTLSKIEQDDSYGG